MDDEKKEWRSIQIRYMDGCFTEILKSDLEKIEAIDDVISALQRGKNLAAELKGIFGE